MSSGLEKKQTRSMCDGRLDNLQHPELGLPEATVDDRQPLLQTGVVTRVLTELLLIRKRSFRVYEAWGRFRTLHEPALNWRESREETQCHSSPIVTRRPCLVSAQNLFTEY